jgi:hypothetical protein
VGRVKRSRRSGSGRRQATVGAFRRRGEVRGFATERRVTVANVPRRTRAPMAGTEPPLQPPLSGQIEDVRTIEDHRSYLVAKLGRLRRRIAEACDAR